MVEDQERVARRGGRVVERLWNRLREEGWFTPQPSFPPGWPHSWKRQS